MKEFKLSEICVVIPVYKLSPSSYELISLKQVLTILKNYKIFLIAPKGLRLDFYEEMFSNHQVSFRTKTFPRRYFENINSYSALLMNPIFYWKFIKYKFMLIYQLDAYVFRDELMDWCNSGIDYIGAPWFEDFKDCAPESNFIGVGNGGFSLRNIQKSLKTLLSFNRLDKKRASLKSWLKVYNTPKRRIKYFPKFIRDFFFRNNTFWLFNDFQLNEDIFWSMLVPKLSSNYKVASYDEAARFSFELNAPMLFSRIERLPFGCHGWYSFHMEFWKKHIPYPVDK